MPIEIVERWLHLTTQKNQQVMHNVARLWEIGQKAKSPQDILDGLHPWGDCKDLYFHNFIAQICFMVGVLILIFGWIIHAYIAFALTFCIGVLCLFIAYLIYEPSQPVDEVIGFLEHRMIELKYDFKNNQIPEYLPQYSHSTLVISKLKQAFPLFSKGNASNEITQYISTTWQIENKKLPVLLFHYRYISELSISHLNGEQNKIKSTYKNQWGAFIFGIEPLGVAANNRHGSFFEPYTKKWSTSDIFLNENVSIFGYDQQQLARIISPMLTLKLSDFFQNYSGEVIFHFEEKMLCYMGDQNLLARRQQKQKIRDTSHLRGHLRTLRMPEYELFKQQMTSLIS